MAKSMVQQSFGPLPLQRVENEPVADLHKVDAGDLTLDEARLLAGRVVAVVLHETHSALKEMGDKSQVGRWKRGEENPNLAKLIQRAEARKAMAKALLRSVDGVTVRTVVEIEEKSA